MLGSTTGRLRCMGPTGYAIGGTAQQGLQSSGLQGHATCRELADVSDARELELNWALAGYQSLQVEAFLLSELTCETVGVKDSNEV